MNSSTPLVWSRLFLPHPLPPAQVAAFLTRLASDRTGHPVVLETRADETGIQQLIGCDAAFVHPLRRLLTDLIPGTIMAGLDTYVRPTMIAAGHLTHKPASLPLASADPLAQATALYSALARQHPSGEAVCVQTVLGRGSSPSTVPSKIPAPDVPLWHALTSGLPDAQHETRNRIRDRAAHHSLDAIVRIGVQAASSAKRERLARELHAALAIAETPGVKLSLKREDPNRINLAPLTRRGVRQLAVPELVALTGWPLGNTPLPGTPPAHPKLLRADASVFTGKGSFAQSSVPGDERLLGIAPSDMNFHGYVLGPTGVGKSHLLALLAENAIRNGQPVLVLDPKAEMHEYLLERIPEARWKDVAVVDGTEENPLGFNPLDATGRDPDVVADSILADFAKVFADGWGPRTADIFSASLRLLTRTGTVDRPHTIVDLPRLWTDPVFRRPLIAQVTNDIALTSFWAWFESLKPAAQANALASPMNKIRQVLLRPAAVKILGQPKPGLHLRDIFREKKIVLLPLNEGLLGPLTTTLISTLVISEVWQAVQERATEQDRAKRPGLVIVDEADRFMNLTVSLEDATARSRSMAVSWWLASQHWDQLSKEMRSAAKTNLKNKVIFRLESDDDARTVARLAPDLSPEDFMSLGKYQVYLRLVADGITTPWALGDVLPPTPAISNAAEVRRIGREHHQPDLAQPPVEAAPHRMTDADQQLLNEPIGRRRRQP